MRLSLHIEEKGEVWIATGNGPLRPIITEGHTRMEAFKGYDQTFGQQLTQQRWLKFNGKPSKD